MSNLIRARRIKSEVSERSYQNSMLGLTCPSTLVAIVSAPNVLGQTQVLGRNSRRPKTAGYLLSLSIDCSSEPVPHLDAITSEAERTDRIARLHVPRRVTRQQVEVFRAA